MSLAFHLSLLIADVANRLAAGCAAAASKAGAGGTMHYHRPSQLTPHGLTSELTQAGCAPPQVDTLLAGRRLPAWPRPPGSPLAASPPQQQLHSAIGVRLIGRGGKNTCTACSGTACSGSPFPNHWFGRGALIGAAVGPSHRATPHPIAVASVALSSSPFLESWAWSASRYSSTSARSTTRSRLFFDDVGPAAEAEPSRRRSSSPDSANAEASMSVGEPSRLRQDHVAGQYSPATTSRFQRKASDSPHGNTDGLPKAASSTAVTAEYNADQEVADPSFSAAPGDATTISLAIASARTLRDVEGVLRQYGRLFRSQHVVQLLAVLPAIEAQGINAGPRMAQIIRWDKNVECGR